MKFIKALLFLCVFLIFPNVVKAQETNCQNRFVTFVNPVRGRNLWGDKSISPLQKQYEILAGHNYPATWLLQYDALIDEEIANTIKGFPIKGETGVFLEVSRNLGEDAGVATPIYTRWSDPGTVFLSAYSQSERKKLIDKTYSKFKAVFGYYPKSVGAWWIDSYSLNYIKNKYGLEAVVVVADQKTTDSYGVWGQWWGVSYYPSKENILIPSLGNNNLGSVVIQWAQRDPELAYGEGPSFSNFSLQANDYVRSGKDTSYFVSVVSKYLDCRNKIGQITVGLETGMESIEFSDEYSNQAMALSENFKFEALVMSDFARVFKSVYSSNPQQIRIGDWVMTPNYRKNEKLGEYINYNQYLSFKDYFLKDNSTFLDRALPIDGNVKSLIPWYLFVSFILLLFSFLFNLFKVWFYSTLVLLVGYGLVLRSTYKFGWEVFYGPQIQNLELVQIFVVITIFGITAFINRTFKNKFNLWLLPLAFGLDRIISILRYTSIEGTKYFGIVLGNSGLMGIKIFGRSLSFTNQSFEPIQFHSLIKFNFSVIWQNQFLYLIIYPAVHFALAFMIWKLLSKLSERIRFILLIILFTLFVWQLQTVFTADPLSIVPIN